MRARKLLATTLMVAALGTGLAQPASAEEATPASADTAWSANSSQQARPANLPAENMGKAKDTATVPSAIEDTTAQEPTPEPGTEKEVSHPKKEVEVQVEYLQHRFFKNRHIDNYNLHVYKKWKSIHALSIYGGVTLTGAKGYLIEDKHPGVHKDSDAVGIGPSVLLRWEKHVSGKLYADLDASGSLRLFGKVHPDGGRAYDFLWRIGPRLTYRCTDDTAVSLGYMYAHMSNGWGSHNPGYNGVGFSLGFQHRF